MPSEVAPVAAAPVTAPAAVAPVTPTPAAHVVATGTPAVVPAVTAPIEYRFDAVEGVDPAFDAGVGELAKTLGWDLETAKKFRAHEIGLAKTEAEADKVAAESAKTAEAQRVAQEDAAWERANRAHPEFGGQRYDETSTKIDKLFAEYDKSGELSKHLAQVPRLKAEPAFRSFLAQIAHAHGEGRFVQGSNAPAAQQQGATLSEMYPSMKR